MKSYEFFITNKDGKVIKGVAIIDHFGKMKHGYRLYGGDKIFTMEQLKEYETKPRVPEENRLTS